MSLIPEETFHPFHFFSDTEVSIFDYTSSLCIIKLVSQNSIDTLYVLTLIILCSLPSCWVFPRATSPGPLDSDWSVTRVFVRATVVRVSVLERVAVRELS